MGGSNDPSNIVRLTPEEHFLAHQLLVRIYPDHRGLVFALRAMTLNVQGLRPNNKRFGWIRRRVAEAIREQKTGVPRPPEVTEKVRAALSGRPLSDIHSERISAANKGRPHTSEHNAKVSASLKGRPSPMRGRQHSEETKQKMRAAATARKHTPETIAKLTNVAASQTKEQRSARAFKAWETKRAKA